MSVGGSAGIFLRCLSILILASVVGVHPSCADDFDQARAEAKTLVDQEKYALAGKAFEAILTSEERLFGRDDLRLAPDLIDLGSVYENIARYADSESAYRRAIDLLRGSANSNKSHLAIALNDLGLLYYRMGKYHEAEGPSKESIEIRREIFDPGDLRMSFPMDNLGLVYLEEGRYEEAEELFQGSIGIARAAKSSVSEAISLDNLGYLYWAQGRLKDAERLHRNALDLEEKSTDAKSADVAITLNSLGSVLVDEDLLQQAEPILQRSLNLWQGVYGDDHPQVAYALANLGALYQTQRRFFDADPLLRKALEIRRRWLGPDHPNTAILIDKLAELLLSRDGVEEAEKLALSALEIKIRALGPDHPEVATTLDLLANVNEKLGHLSQALEFARKSSALRRSRASLMAKARSRGADSEIRKVRESYVRHVSILSQLIKTGAPNRDQLIAEAFEVGQSAQASAAANAAFQAGIRHATPDPHLAMLVRQRQDAIDAWRGADAQRSELIALAVSQRDSDTERAVSEEMRRLEAEISGVDDRFAHEFPQFTELASPTPIALAVAQARLGDGEELISVLVGNKSAFLWAVRRLDADLVPLDLDSDQLDGEVKALRELLDPQTNPKDPQTNPKLEAFDLPRSHALYERTIGKAAHILEVNRILFVPDGAFLSLPIGVLVQSKTANDADYASVSWLARRYAITVLPSASMLVTMRTASVTNPARRPFVGIGDPSLEGPDPKAELPSLVSLFRGPMADVDAVRHLPPLHETAQELRDLARSQHASEQDLFLGDRATETLIKASELGQYRIVAFATHGLLAGGVKDLVEPALVLTPPVRPSKEDDGLLTASEVARLVLDADWVILSACNTASGDGSHAEGLSGLAKSFIYAGSRALLVSHWKVASQAALNLTTGMFKALDADTAIDKAEALKRSQIAAIENHPGLSHPQYWAPFVLVGDPRRD
jgi:CHAT domain-containing protein/Tfp pilus assembly protein PilF